MKLLTYEETAKLCRCSKKTVERAVKRGEIDAYRPGKFVLLDADSVSEWFKSKKIQPVRTPGPKRRSVVVNL